MSRTSSAIRRLSFRFSKAGYYKTRDMSPLEQLPPSLAESACDTRQPEISTRVKEELSRKSRDSFTSQTPFEENALDLALDMEDEQCMIEEATILEAKEMKTKEITIEPPAIPQRNSLRASKLLDSLKLDSIETATQSLNSSHDVYLSSEEEASTSAGEFSDDDFDSDSEYSGESSPRRRSQEDTARAVTVVFVGKPCLVDLPSSRRPTTPVRKRPQSNIFERSSTSSASSSLDTGALENHRPRQSSLASIHTDLSKGAPSFLTQDPFPTSNYKLDSQNKDPIPSGPRTPRSSTALHRFQKSISLARKRSRSNLKATVSSDNLAQLASAAAGAKNLRLSLNTSSPPTAAAEELEPPVKSEAPPSATTTTTNITATSSTTTLVPQSPRTYNEILRAARKNAQPPPSPSAQAMSPMSPATAKKGILSGLNINRRRSVRVKS
ncbi:hypothetical protein F4810DRAFT_695899 [Camillea tinctor]|nr:hypothetical protein F4810DRAFT_695899 [Camillea tinctor]